MSGMGEARDLDHPHFTENYILREMGFQIARKHASRLRRIAVAVGFVLPALLGLAAAFGIAPAATSIGAVVLAGIGLFVERWLFFAEATHVSALYYGRAA